MDLRIGIHQLGEFDVNRHHPKRKNWEPIARQDLTLKVVGAGLGRTGTYSLKLALEQLLGAPCYHMAEVPAHPEHIPLWHQAIKGKIPDWNEIFGEFRAAVDDPTSHFWKELSQAYPEALIILSVRDSESWWKSSHNTIFRNAGNDARPVPQSVSDWYAMITDMRHLMFPNGVLDKKAAIEGFEQHYQEVLQTIPTDRLLEWQATEGWEPT